MNINASIVDQRLIGIINDYPTLLPGGDEIGKKSKAFVLLCISTCLDISIEEASELVTDGGNDAGVDGLYVGVPEDGQFVVTIFQAKYKTRNLSGDSNFPENGVQKAVDTARTLFDPYRDVALNDRIEPKIEEVRSLIRDGYIPTVRMMFCNNGARWISQAELSIKAAKKEFGDKIEFIHFNHDSIVSILQTQKAVDASLTFSGNSIVEDMNYLRVMIGRVSVREIHRLFNEHGDRLLQRNIRRYLGLRANRVNTAISETLRSTDKSDNFYFYNNGITLVCDKFDFNAFQKDDRVVQFKNLQIINGGQTCKTIQETLNEAGTTNIAGNSCVMIRAYQLSESNKDFILDITFATNSQNPVDLRDLRSNDEIQKQLEIGIADLGYEYKRHREEGLIGSKSITPSVTAEAVLSIWRKRPHQAKFRRSEHFGRLYEDIFCNLNASQALIAVTIFRFVENERKKSTQPVFLVYAAHYISMLVGRSLLEDVGVGLDRLTHLNFKDALDKFEDKKSKYFDDAVKSIDTALKKCYGEREVSLQQLSATFRRSDLLEMLFR
ncbi:MAG: AIPR family protein [Planctomycetes bacterium]|nr:AIPR family protein [Planctomycetota bacterium]